MTEKNEIRFRTFQQYKKHFAPEPEPDPNEPDYSGKSPEFMIGVEIARRAADAARQEIEEERNRAPWERGLVGDNR